MDNQYIEKAENVLLHTYNRYKIVLEKGEGAYLIDCNGRKYLDFAAGIAVCALGYSNEEYKEALKNQVDTLLHTSNLFYNEPIVSAGEKFIKASGMDRVFFTNSGTESIEGALKAARKYSYTKYGKDRYEIVAMNHSFHGRSMGAVSVTGNEHYREPFEPLIGGVKFAEYNDFESVKAAVSDKTCAIILETVQGEGGIFAADADFLKQIRKLCDEKDILLILDEIQCGMGRCGTMFAYQRYNLMPDIMTSAKALGCGVPVGAFAMTEAVAKYSLAPGDHGTTYGGNPFVGAAVEAVFEQFDKLNIIDHVNEVGKYFEGELDKLAGEFDNVCERRGIGLLQGLVLDSPVADVISKAMEKGLIVISASGNVLRMAPPLIITKAQVDEMIAILRECL